MSTTPTTCTGCAAIVQRWRRRARREGLDVRSVPPFLLDAACRDCGGEPLRQLAEEATR